MNSKQKCPYCNYIFICGFENNPRCPECKKKFAKQFNQGANNVYYNDGSPAIMSDGRFITYRNSTNELTESLRKLNGIASPNEFRTFMQNNANKFMDGEKNYVNSEAQTGPKIACSQGFYQLSKN